MSALLQPIELQALNVGSPMPPNVESYFMTFFPIFQGAGSLLIVKPESVLRWVQGWDSNPHHSITASRDYESRMLPVYTTQLYILLNFL